MGWVTTTARQREADAVAMDCKQKLEEWVDGRNGEGVARVDDRIVLRARSGEGREESEETRGRGGWPKEKRRDGERGLGLSRLWVGFSLAPDTLAGLRHSTGAGSRDTHTEHAPPVGEGVLTGAG